MKNHLKLASLAMVMTSLSGQFNTAHAQGNLTPPGAPGPVMKTLDQVHPGIPLPASVGYLNITNSGCYYLVTNLTINDGITISTNDVCLDLNGFRMNCTIANPALTVSFSGGPYTNIVIRNGTIANSGYGAVDAQNAEHVVCENLLITDCAANNDALAAGPRSIVRHCALYNVNGGIIAGQESVVEDCIVANSHRSGISVDTNSVVRRCLVSRCTWSGISAVNGGVIANNVVSNCGFGNNNGGIEVFYGGTRIEGNHLSHDYSWVSVTGATNFIFCNSAIDCGAAYLGGLPQVLGPIISTPGTITNNSPWANFVF